MTDALEKIIRPIVEGQIRGFLKEHPSIVNAVDWYKPRADKETTFVNSLSKRICRDLLCGQSSSRIRAAVLASQVEAQPPSTVELVHCGERGPSGMNSGWSVASRVRAILQAAWVR